ncbi:hypothetical protein GIB67_012563 [Kingdonia uniflora]|uniref:Metallo-beta-lactamase domain-containing protein n=1 Tax=Kingdonia uniflora TaxID=39325 RepID=A0A7J7NEQ2_9MAGN|nr:hypothetical protein GIB67_012563 [Kingdonia uniflora]
MATLTTKLAVILKSTHHNFDFLLVKQTPPSKLGEEEYDSYVDSNLWDLPSTTLNPIEVEQESLSTTPIVIEGTELCSDKLNLRNFDVDSALKQVLVQTGLDNGVEGNWMFWRYVDEAEFGPGKPVGTIFLLGKYTPDEQEQNLQGISKWISIKACLDLLSEVKPLSERVGPMAFAGLLRDPVQSGGCKVPSALQYQEYPPGITIVPMRSRTAKPFHTTNLVVVAPDNITDCCEDLGFIAYGDALIVDPGCQSQCHKELAEIVCSLPRKLVVFVTHHHHDHVDGLSIIQKCNPDATLLAHENTFRRLGKDDWSLGYTAISGGEEISIGGQRMKAIFSPGHTDDHMALLHVSTHSLIVGDHCVGQGSAVLDISSGGNMKASEILTNSYEYLSTPPLLNGLLPNHLQLSGSFTSCFNSYAWESQSVAEVHALRIPQYLAREIPANTHDRNRRNREASILKAIESGAHTLYDIVAKTYADVDPSFWIPASWNVRLHIDHLSQLDILPKSFSSKTSPLKTSMAAAVLFLIRWALIVSYEETLNLSTRQCQLTHSRLETLFLHYPDFSLQKFQKTCRLHFILRWTWMYLRVGLIFKKHKLNTVALLTATAVVGSAMLYSYKGKFLSK